MIKIILLLLTSWKPAASSAAHAADKGVHPRHVCMASLQEACEGSDTMPSAEAIGLGLEGYWHLRSTGLLSANDKLTIIDFSLPSTEKRLWVFDLDEDALLLHTFVAHGQGTGENMAHQFSNIPASHQSSLGFYRTAETYQGKHGLSLFLDGLEPGLNDKARERYVVMHGAAYASEDFIATHGRLGRSYGCPAVPYEHSAQLIEAIKEGSCLFIYHPSAQHYTANYYRELIGSQEG